ncbi:DUF2514 family protein [Pseudomonas sp. AL 58]|uniref:DUF2514 family protein n=1 Tax=Pseudomonas sp. AL 58 TaxID=3104275 RepID=UPI0008116468|nr:DUF2514 family protein [Pseudomonas defluvii]MEE3636357.1 DUF2514 family protein [Pseudomonas sp. AL 58]
MTWSRALGALVLLALVGLAFWSTYQHGRSTMDAEWQVRWSDRDAGDKQAWALAEAADREKEQARQQAINKVIQDGQTLIDQASADAAAARATAASLRDEADRLASGTASKASSHSCTTAASQAATRAVMVLADVFKRADERAGDLAEYADQSRSRGVTCEKAYTALIE